MMLRVIIRGRYHYWPGQIVDDFGNVVYFRWIDPRFALSKHFYQQRH